MYRTDTSHLVSNLVGMMEEPYTSPPHREFSKTKKAAPCDCNDLHHGYCIPFSEAMFHQSKSNYMYVKVVI